MPGYLLALIFIAWKINLTRSTFAAKFLFVNEYKGKINKEEENVKGKTQNEVFEIILNQQLEHLIK